MCSGQSSVGNRRATAKHVCFFAFGETALASLPALLAHMDVLSVSRAHTPKPSCDRYIRIIAGMARSYKTDFSASTK